MKGTNFLYLNHSTMIEIIQLWLNDRYLARGHDTVPLIAGIEYMREEARAYQANGADLGHFRIRMVERVNGSTQSGQAGAPNKVTQAPQNPALPSNMNKVTP